MLLTRATPSNKSALCICKRLRYGEDGTLWQTKRKDFRLFEGDVEVDNMIWLLDGMQRQKVLISQSW